MLVVRIDLSALVVSLNSLVAVAKLVVDIFLNTVQGSILRIVLSLSDKALKLTLLIFF